MNFLTLKHHIALIFIVVFKLRIALPHILFLNLLSTINPQSTCFTVGVLCVYKSAMYRFCAEKLRAGPRARVVSQITTYFINGHWIFLSFARRSLKCHIKWMVSLFTITLLCVCSYTPPKFDLQIAWLCPCNSHVNLVSEVNTEYCPYVCVKRAGNTHFVWSEGVIRIEYLKGNWKFVDSCRSSLDHFVEKKSFYQYWNLRNGS